MSLREEKQAHLRNQLIDAAEALFREHGFDETRVEEIAARARVSRQTFFNYFGTKEQVLREAGIRWLSRGIEHSRMALEEGQDSRPGALVEFRKYLRRQARAIEDDRAFMALVYTRSGVAFPQGKRPARDDARLDLTHRGFEVLAAPFRRAQRAGEIRTDIDPQQIAEMIFAIQFTTTRLWLMDYWKRGGRLETRLLRAYDVIVDGLRIST